MLHVLPLHGAWADGVVRLEPPWVSLEFVHVKVADLPLVRPGFDDGLSAMTGKPKKVPSEEPMIEDTHTWVEATTHLGLLQGEDEDLPTATFERCLHAINRVVGAVGVATRNPRFVRFGKERLDPVVMMRHVPVESDESTAPGPKEDDGEGKVFGIMLLHTIFPILPGHQTVDELALQSLLTLDARQYPFLKYQQWFARARHAATLAGDYDDAIAKLETAVEVLLFGCARVGMADRGFSSRAIDERLKGVRYRSLVTKIVPEVIGGSWDVTVATSAVGAYWTELYGRRNRIVHAGATMTSRDYWAADAAYQALLEHLIASVLRQPRKLARTAYGLLGEAGLRERGHWSPWMQEKISEFHAATTPFWHGSSEEDASAGVTDGDTPA